MKKNNLMRKSEQTSINQGVSALMNATISFGVHSMILQSFSTFKRVIFLFFFKLSSVLLSIPDFNNKYCDISFRFIVSQSG